MLPRYFMLSSHQSHTFCFRDPEQGTVFPMDLLNHQVSHSDQHLHLAVLLEIKVWVMPWY